MAAFLVPGCGFADDSGGRYMLPGVGFVSAESGPDVTAPVLTDPVGTQTGGTTATVGATTDEGNGTLYAVVTTSATTPTFAQVAAGNDHTGSAAVWDGSVAVSSVGAKTLNATGLTPSTAYYAHLGQADAALNESNVVSSAQFTTTSGGDETAPEMFGVISVTRKLQTSYVLTWEAATDNLAVTGYEVSVNAGVDWDDVGNVLITRIGDRTPGDTDEVHVRAYDAAANVSTALTTSVTLESEVTGATIRAETATGDYGPGIMYNDWDDAGDDAKLFAYDIETWPTSGTFTPYPNGSFTWTGLADGVHSFEYRLKIDGVWIGYATVTVTVGESEPVATAQASTLVVAVKASGEVLCVVGLTGGQAGLSADGELYAIVANRSVLLSASGEIAVRL